MKRKRQIERWHKIKTGSTGSSLLKPVYYKSRKQWKRYKRTGQVEQLAKK